MNQNAEQVFLCPGDIYVSNRPGTISTILGSCVGVLLWDEYQRVGGMNHFILPRDENGKNSCRYGEVAILKLLRMMREYGCKRSTICAHIAGGASPAQALRNSVSIGKMNVSLAKEMLHHHRIPISQEHTGGNSGYRVQLSTLNGVVEVETMSSVRPSDWYDKNGNELQISGDGQHPFERRKTARPKGEEITRPW